MPRAVGSEGPPNALAVNSRFVHYVAELELVYGDGTRPVYCDKGIFRQPLAGGPRETVALDPTLSRTLEHPSNPARRSRFRAIDCARAETATRCAEQRTIRPLTTVATVLCTLLAVADEYVYFRTFAKLPLTIDFDSCDVDFRRVLVSGGDVETIATRTSGANALVVEGSDIFWIANDRVLRTALE